MKYISNSGIKMLCICLTFVLIFSSLNVFAAYDDKLVLTIDTPDTVKLGSNFEVKIDVSQEISLTTMELYVAYDNNILEYEGYTRNENFIDNFTPTTQTEGIQGFIYGGSKPFNIDGTILTLNFKAKALGDSEFSLQKRIILAGLKEQADPSDPSQTQAYTNIEHPDTTVTVVDGGGTSPSPTPKPTTKPTNGGGGGGGAGSQASPSPTATTTPTAAPTPTPKPTIIPVVKSFNDLAGYEWANEAISGLSSVGIVNGTSGNSFNPGSNVTRAEFAKMVVSLFNMTDKSKAKQFTDVTSNDWFKDYVDIASSNGIVNGYEDNTFGPDNSITREDLCVMVVRGAKSIGLELPSAELNFADNDFNEYSKDSVGILSKLGIVNGKEDGLFAPGDNANRAEAAKIIYGIYKLLNK